jgi:hypothetical protein
VGIKAFIGKILSFSHTEENGDGVSEVTIDPGGGANVSGINYSPMGDDSQPLPEDFAVAVPISGTGVNVFIGYVDPKNDQKSRAGEKRIYARNSRGALKVELWLKKDGSAVLSNDLGTVELKINGNVEANGAIIDITGDVTTPEGISLRTHVHVSADPGVNTGPPI